MKKTLLFLLLLMSVICYGQDSTIVKDGVVYEIKVTESPLGDLSAATGIVSGSITSQLGAMSNDIAIVSQYPKQVTAIIKRCEQFAAQTGVSVLDSFYYKNKSLFDSQEWYLGDVAVNFRHNGKQLQFRTDTTSTWARAYFLEECVVLKGGIDQVFFKKNQGFVSVGGVKLSRDRPIKKRSPVAPPTTLNVFFNPDGTVVFDGQTMKYNPRKKIWVQVARTE